LPSGYKRQFILDGSPLGWFYYLIEVKL
jgi:hypothetical protein